MTPEERARDVVDTLGIHEGNRNYRYAVREVRERIEAAVAEEREACMREVNRVFCRGLSSILDLGFMRDMHARVVAAEEREACEEVVHGYHLEAHTTDHGECVVCSMTSKLARAIRARAEGARP